jgi:hypothetical protein
VQWPDFRPANTAIEGKAEHIRTLIRVRVILQGAALLRPLSEKLPHHTTRSTLHKPLFSQRFHASEANGDACSTEVDQLRCNDSDPREQLNKMKADSGRVNTKTRFGRAQPS